MASHANQQVLEVVVLWAGDPISVVHHASFGSYCVGKRGSSCSLALPPELLGSEQVCVAVRKPGTCYAVASERCQASIVDQRGKSKALPSVSASSSHRLIPLALGSQARLGFGAIEIRVSLVADERAPLRQHSWDTTLWSSLALVGGMSGLLLWLGAWSEQATGLLAQEDAPKRQLRRMRRYLDAAAERAQQAPESGQQFTERSRAAPRRASNRPSADAADQAWTWQHSPPSLAQAFDGRQLDLREAQRFGIVEAIREMAEDDYSKSFAFVEQPAPDEVEASREVFSGELEDSVAGGLRASGTGIRGGGKAKVIEGGPIRTIAQGTGSPDVLPEKGLVARVSRGGGFMMRKHEGVLDGSYVETLPMPVRMRLASIRRCVRTEVGDSAPPPGLVQLKLQLDDSSRPHRVRATGPSWAPRRVLACVEGAFYGVHFAELSGQRSVAISVTL